jgi:hypothetical protein
VADDTIERTAFIARGQAPVGFRTSAARIEKGVDVVGNELGVRGKGPTGVVGLGEDAGVRGVGKGAGVRGVGEGEGRGGEFLSARYRAHVNLAPHAMDGGRVQTKVVTPVEFVDPSGGLPATGQIGDLWAWQTADPDPVPEEVPDGVHFGREQPLCHLWLCVRRSSGSRPAQWAQVLLGTPHEGRHPLP